MLYTRVTELAFKRHGNVVGHGATVMVVFFCGEMEKSMNIYIYSDESGVFDKKHNDIFVFGGIIILGNPEKLVLSRKYAKAEKDIRKSQNLPRDYELKATAISNGDKGKLFRSLNQYHKFGVIIEEKRVLDRIFESKKDKQRYLDYAYKIAVRRAFEDLIKQRLLIEEEVRNLYFFVDEHTTATNGCYELREGLEQEFKNGTYNWKYDTFFPPIFSKLESVQLTFCNSKNKLLVRSADIVANKIFYYAKQEDHEKLRSIKNLYVTYLP